jgi:hypothetical protein
VRLQRSCLFRVFVFVVVLVVVVVVVVGKYAIRPRYVNDIGDTLAIGDIGK